MQRVYLILNQKDQPLANAVLESPLDADILQFRLLEGDPEELALQGGIELIGGDEGSPDFAGVITRIRGDRILVQPTAPLSDQTRKNLRMPTEFDSYIYPVDESWVGRSPVHGVDISCGGIAFCCERPLQVGEVVQLVLPITEAPLLLNVEILRVKLDINPHPLYAARFLDLNHDEESMIRRAVFHIQMNKER